MTCGAVSRLDACIIVLGCRLHYRLCIDAVVRVIVRSPQLGSLAFAHELDDAHVSQH
jgi:hypothetical protein